MNKYFTSTNETIVAANGKTLCFQVLLEAARKNFEYLIKTKYSRLPEKEWDDVLQDIYIRVYNGCKSYNPDKSKPSTWTSHLVRNALYDRAKKLKKYSKEILINDMYNNTNNDVYRDMSDEYDQQNDYISDRIACDYAADWGLIKKENEVDNDACIKKLYTTIGTLNEKDRNIIYLRIMEELEVNEIARRLGCTANSVSVTRTRTLATLKKWLGKDFLSKYSFAA